ncbi:MAG: hypothetical protein AAF844_00205 [Pseudomonadota bacterium]
MSIGATPSTPAPPAAKPPPAPARTAPRVTDENTTNEAVRRALAATGNTTVVTGSGLAPARTTQQTRL